MFYYNGVEYNFNPIIIDIQLNHLIRHEKDNLSSGCNFMYSYN